VPLSNLTSSEVAIVGECLRAAAYGPFFPDAEFGTLLGLSRQEVQEISDRFPNLDEADNDSGELSDASLAINNAFANLIGYPHGVRQRWSQYISVSPDDLKALLYKWRG